MCNLRQFIYMYMTDEPMAEQINVICFLVQLDSRGYVYIIITCICSDASCWIIH